MMFILHRDPDNKIQKIPYAVLQVSALADAEELTVQTGDGCVLLCRNVLTTREAVGTIAHLYEAIDSLMEQLVDASKEAASELEDGPDPLEELDENVLDDLLACGADPDGLRLLLALEEESEDE